MGEETMADLQATTISGVDTVLKEAAVAAFKQGLRGQLIVPGDDSYAEARRVWNGNIDRRPGLIARPAGVADVIQAVNFARDHNLLVAVRGGAHSFAGTCVCNGGLVIDLSLMKGIRVDPVRREVRAKGGVKWGEFDRETQAFGLATTGGTDPDTGIAGLTLGGGLGWLGYKYGFASDNLTSVDIITADGTLRVASDTEHPDLFWGVRGGGGNFGVVTSFEYRLHPVGPVLAGLVLHPFAKAREALQFYRDFSSATHEEVTTYAGLLTSPEGAKTVAIGVCYSGPLAEGERLIAPVRRFGPPLEDQICPMAYTELQSMFDPAYPPGNQYYQKDHFLREISDDAIDIVVEHFASVSSPCPYRSSSRAGVPCGGGTPLAPTATLSITWFSPPNGWTLRSRNATSTGLGSCGRLCNPTPLVGSTSITLGARKKTAQTRSGRPTAPTTSVWRS
jgi:hypothetical protein